MDQAGRLRELVNDRLPGRARVITIASGKGGVGKTSIAVNLGLILARQGRRTLIFDADLGLANVDILLGIVPPYSLQEVISGRRRLEEVVIRGPQGLLLVPGANGAGELADLPPGMRDRLLDELAGLAAGLDIILVDCGAGISRTVISFAAAAGEVLVVTTPEPTAITDAYSLIKGLKPFRVEVQLLINRAAGRADGQQTAARLQGACRRFLQQDLPLLGIIPEDPRMGQAARAQRPVSLTHPNCPAARALEGIAAGLQGRRPPSGRQAGFWQVLGRLLGR